MKGKESTHDNDEETRSKPRELKPHVKRFILIEAIRQRNVPRELLANRLIKEIEEAGEIAPTIETAKKYISKARNSDNPIGRPWTIGCCSEYSTFFPPDSIPVLLECKQWLSKLSGKDANEYKRLFGRSISDFSIRQAIWIIRLKPLSKIIYADEIARSKKKRKEKEVRIASFLILPTIYSEAEQVSEVLGEDHFDTNDLDTALMTNDWGKLGTLLAYKTFSICKPIKCDHNCESCKYQKHPYLKNTCIPKPKEVTNERNDN